MGAFEACRTEGDGKEKALETAAESFELLEKRLEVEGRKYFGGEEIGYLDLALGWVPHGLNVMEEVG